MITTGASREVVELLKSGIVIPVMSNIVVVEPAKARMPGHEAGGFDSLPCCADTRCWQRRFTMPKVLRCGDLMPGCNAVIEGKDEAEVMAKGAEHAKTVHKMTAIPPDIAAKVKAAIRDKK